MKILMRIDEITKVGVYIGLYKILFENIGEKDKYDKIP